MTELPVNYEIQDMDGTAVARFTEQPHFAYFQMADIVDEFRSAAGSCRTRSLILNLTGIDYLDSASFGELARLRTQIDQTGGQMALCNPADTVRDILDVTRLDRHFLIFPDLDTALASITAAQRGEDGSCQIDGSMPSESPD